MIVLDVGCGRNKLSSGSRKVVGIDKSKDSDADVIVDIEKERLPFKDESIDRVYTSHTLEHIENILFVMNEFWRVLKWDGLLTIEVPHKDCDLAWQDPTHKRYFVEDSFKFFCGEYLVKHKLDYGIDCAFKERNSRLFYPNGEKEKKYCTMIYASFSKHKEHYSMFSKKFPFRKNKIQDDKETHIDEFNGHINRIIEIKKDATKRYGSNPAPLGLKGLYADLNRKHTRLKRWLWEGEKHTKEGILDTLYDNAIYSILCAMEIEREEKIAGKQGK